MNNKYFIIDEKVNRPGPSDIILLRAKLFDDIQNVLTSEQLDAINTILESHNELWFDMMNFINVFQKDEHLKPIGDLMEKILNKREKKTYTFEDIDGGSI